VYGNDRLNDYTYPHNGFWDILDEDDGEIKQGDLIDDIAKFINKRQNNIYFLKGMTGVGKTDVTIASGIRSRNCNRIFYVAPTRYLQRQGFEVAKSFADVNDDVDVNRIKGRSNYQCLLSTDKTADKCVSSRYRPCSYKPRNVESEPPSGNSVITRTGNVKVAPSKMCDYYERKFEAIPRKVNNNDNRIILMTTQYFLTEVIYAKELNQADLVIFDEASNLEQNLVNTTSVSLEESFLDYIFGYDYPIRCNDNNYESVKNWLDKLYNDLSIFIEDMEGHIGGNSNDYHKEMRTKSAVRVCEEIEYVADNWDEDNIAIDIVDNSNSYNDDNRKLRVRFIDVSEEFGYIINNMITNNGTAILMSATLQPHEYFNNVFNLGRYKTKYKVIHSGWDSKNRPVTVMNGIKLNNRNLDDRKYDMFNVVNEIADVTVNDNNENLILHTHTNSLKKFFVEGLSDEFDVISHDMKGHSRDLETAVNMFKNGNGLILVSPSAYEGVDFKGGICRVQAIIKVPFPNMYDAWMEKKCNKHSDYYFIETVKTIEQTIGRLVRSPDDYGMTIILDSAFNFLAYKSDLEGEHWDNLTGFRSNENVNKDNIVDMVSNYLDKGKLTKEWKDRNKKYDEVSNKSIDAMGLN